MIDGRPDPLIVVRTSSTGILDLAAPSLGWGMVEVKRLLNYTPVVCGFAAFHTWEVHSHELRRISPLELLALAADDYPVDDYVRDRDGD